jgi:hypothetical protein
MCFLSVDIFLHLRIGANGGSMTRYCDSTVKNDNYNPHD